MLFCTDTIYLKMDAISLLTAGDEAYSKRNFRKAVELYKRANEIEETMRGYENLALVYAK